MRQPSTRTLWSLVLLVLSLVLLTAGGFVQLDDTSGFGSSEWNLPIGCAAGVLAVTALVVAFADEAARRAMAAALGVVLVLLLVLSRFDEGFRFVFGGDEGELVFLQVGLGLVIMALVLPLRVLAYAATLVVAVSVAFFAGAAHFSRTQCANGDGECDLGFIEGLVWSGVAAVAVLVAVAVIEVSIARRPHAQELEPD